MICPPSPEGFICGEGDWHLSHSARVKDDSVNGWHYVYWNDPLPTPSPDGTRHTPGTSEMIAAIHEMEAQIDKGARRRNPEMSRTVDPSTSVDAGDAIDREWTDKHGALYDWLVEHPGVTDLMIGEAAKAMGLRPTEELGRRMARSLREIHNMMEPFVPGDAWMWPLDVDLHQVRVRATKGKLQFERKNKLTDRYARCWKASEDRGSNERRC